MKKSTTVLTTICCSLIVIGSACAVAGRMMGAESAIVYEKGKGLQIIKHEQPELFAESQNLETFSSISVDDMDEFQIRLVASDHYGYEMHAYDQHKPRISVEHDTLSISGIEEDLGLSDVITIDLGLDDPIELERETLDIYYPADAQFENISFEGSRCNLEMASLSVQDLEVKGDYANVLLNEVTGDTMDISAYSGNVLLDDVQFERKINCEMVGGTFEVDNAQTQDFRAKGDNLNNILSNLTADTAVFEGYSQTIDLSDSQFQSTKISGDTTNCHSSFSKMGDVRIDKDFGYFEWESVELNSLYAKGDYQNFVVDGILHTTAQWDGDYQEISLRMENAKDFGWNIDLEYGEAILLGRPYVGSEELVEENGDSVEIADSQGTIHTEEKGNGTQKISVTGEFSSIRLEEK
ncbi:MAG: DUF4097 family beta strand repeat-containing protein [Massiliimalia sp.]|jgi:hypothetical protein